MPSKTHSTEDFAFYSYVDSLSQRLFYMFKDEIAESLALLEKQCVTLLYSANQRQVYQVKSSNKTYHCFKHTYFCTCLSFKHNGMISIVNFSLIRI